MKVHSYTYSLNIELKRLARINLWFHWTFKKVQKNTDCWYQTIQGLFAQKVDKLNANKLQYPTILF